LKPGLEHPDLDVDYKESLRDTLRMLEKRNTVKEIMDFVDDALDRKRGREMHDALKKLGLSTLEDLEVEIRNIAYNSF
jgi:hypothetical protein